MPVSVLWVEGKLDGEILNAILGGTPVVRQGGSKNSLPPRARADREDKKLLVCYLRDRDFDQEPPQDTSSPVADRWLRSDAVLGWRWCRHSIENYLIDPEIVELATGWERASYTAVLRAAALSIRNYQIARWVVGHARSQLRPPYAMHTRPQECADKDFCLPGDLSETGVTEWVKAEIDRFREHVTEALLVQRIEAELQKRSAVLTPEFLDSTANILLWCSGKDLLAALEPSLEERGGASARGFVARVRDWIRDHPDEVLSALPEWQALVRLLRE